MLEVGTTGTVSMRVRNSDLASAFAEADGERYPHVLSTPALLGLMERACAQVMAVEVGEGQLSVGVKTEISHTLRAIEGALYWFDVEATDPSGPVGIATHARAIVDRASIERRAQQRRIG
jgi:fluoroacetyl-CoA thioesterase